MAKFTTYLIELVQANTRQSFTPRKLYAGYRDMKLRESATTDDLYNAPVWHDRESAQKVANNLLGTLSGMWVVQPQAFDSHAPTVD